MPTNQHSRCWLSARHHPSSLTLMDVHRQVLGGLLLTMLVLFVFFVWSARKKKQAEMAAMGA